MEYAAAYIQHMQKVLMEMNLQLHHVVSDITGATGMRIIRAIAAGERDPDVLASLRDVRCHSSIETIRASLVGNDRDEHVFALIQSLELYDFYQDKMLERDRKLEAAILDLTVRTEHQLLWEQTICTSLVYVWYQKQCCLGRSIALQIISYAAS